MVLAKLNTTFLYSFKECDTDRSLPCPGEIEHIYERNEKFLNSIAGTCRKVEFRADLSFHGKRLINHVIRTVESLIDDFCGAVCFMEPSCISYNMEVISGSPSITKCELNNSTHNEHPDDLKPWQNCIYQGAVVSAECYEENTS